MFPRARRLVSGMAMLLLAAGCATCPVDSRTGKKPARTPAPYMRVAYPDADTVSLQIAARKFMPARRHGPPVWLVGASHIGEPEYYAALQRHLDDQGLVLYEGVKGLGEPAAAPGATSPGSSPSRSAGSRGTPAAAQDSLQVKLAHSLGLVFQLDVLDYSAAKFRNSDLTVSQIQKLMLAQEIPAAGANRSPSAPNEAPAESEFETLIQTMQGTSVFGAVLHALVEFIGTSPRLQALTKLAMIELLGRFKGDLSRVEALTPELQHLMEVLIQERNQVVLADLRTACRGQHAPTSVAVIYGAGHLADLEQRLRRKLHYCPAGEKWLPVFSVNTARAGLSRFEIGLVRTFIRAQLRALQPGDSR